MDELDFDGLNAALAGMVSAVRYFEVVDSTNRVAEDWAGEGAADFSLVVAGHQTAGRGRFSRRWFDEPGGGLLFSLVLRPLCPSEQLGLVNLAAAVAVVEALRGAAGEAAVSVKWPNDILLGGPKVGGILASSGESGDLGRWVVLGVGVNIGIREFPGEIAGKATSVVLESGEAPGRLEILKHFLSRFSRLWEWFPDGIVESYRPICETIGREVFLEVGEDALTGKAVDVDEFGRLVLEGGRRISSGEVVTVRGSQKTDRG